MLTFIIIGIFLIILLLGIYSSDVVVKTNFSTDETGKLQVTILGSGNMQLLTAPQIKWPSDVEFFESKSTENIDKTSIPISGSKTFEFPFVISKAGSYSIPSIAFSFFDVQSKTYKIVETKKIDFIIFSS